MTYDKNSKRSIRGNTIRDHVLNLLKQEKTSIIFESTETVLGQFHSPWKDRLLGDIQFATADNSGAIEVSSADLSKGFAKICSSKLNFKGKHFWHAFVSYKNKKEIIQFIKSIVINSYLEKCKKDVLKRELQNGKIELWEHILVPESAFIQMNSGIDLTNFLGIYDKKYLMQRMQSTYRKFK